MIKALLRKTLLATLSIFTLGKNGKKRSKKVIALIVLLAVYVLGASGLMFWMLADALCGPLVGAGMTWVYFAFMGTIATGFGIIGGIFTAKARLYEAKDNDLLLSMPIPSWMILFSRTVGLYGFTFLFEALVFIPAIIRYFTVVGFAFAPFVGCLVVLLILPCLALAISYLLGWLIALLSVKIPGKNIVETALAIAFLVAYYIGYSKINEYLGYVISNGEAVGRIMKTALYPFSQLGYACEGKGLAILLFVLMFVGVFALVYALMSATYLRLATANKGMKKVKYTGKGYKGNGAVLAIMKKELSRYIKNSMLLLNAFMGSILFLLLPFIALFERETFTQLAVGFDGEFVLILAGVLCLVAFTNLFAPSCISLEGAGLDVVRVLPIPTETIFFAKAMANVAITGIPAAFSTIFLCVIFEQGVLLTVCVLLVVSACVVLASVGGLVANLLLPNLKWTNEVAVVKQGMSTLAAMLGGFGVVALLVGGYFLFGKYMPAWGFILICTVALVIGSICACIFLKKRGVRIFEEL